MKSYKLGTAVVAGKDTPVILVEGRVYTLAEVVGAAAPQSIFDVLQEWSRWRAALDAAANPSSPGLDPDALNYRSPIVAPRKVICIGINYRDHLAEMKSGEPPAFPYSFLRPQTSLAGHKEQIRLPAGSKMVDWEAELGIVIGRRFNAGDGGDPKSAIAGYTVLNDVSARDWIASRPPVVGIDWVMQKAWDQFQPTGPWLTPAQFVGDPQNLSIELTVNGVIKQSSNTAQLVFGVEQIVSHLGGIMTLEPGDLIATGTPAGVGFGRKPPEFIKPGDRVTVKIAELGTLENIFI